MHDHDNRELVKVLIENPSPVVRSQAHVELARRARAQGDDVKALRHYREALHHDPGDSESTAAVRELEGRLEPDQKRGLFTRVWRKVRS